MPARAAYTPLIHLTHPHVAARLKTRDTLEEMDAVRVQDTLGLVHPPVAIGFFDAHPSGVAPWDGGPAPAGCAFWRAAMEGRCFYTAAADHYNCAVGSYTHAIVLPPERAAELQDTVGFMVANGYIAMSEVPGIPTLAKSPAYVAYAPVDKSPFRPDVVLVAARPASAMLLYEAAVRAGAAGAPANILGRPGCALLPLVSRTGQTALSFGCIGNRTFTGLPDDELYIAVPGTRWDEVAAAVTGVAAANSAMGQYYRGRQAQFPIL